MKHLNQKGSAHVVVTVCLVVVLIFALGWIFWQNFVHKEPTKKDTDLVVVDKDMKSNGSSSNTTGNKKSSNVDSSTTNLALSKWGLHVPIRDDSYGFTAKYESFNGDNEGVYEISSTTVRKRCGGSAAGAIGVIVKNPESQQENVAASVNVGGNTYVFSFPQSACGDPSTAYGKETNTLQSNGTKVFTNYFKNLTAS